MYKGDSGEIEKINENSCKLNFTSYDFYLKKKLLAFDS